MRTRTAAIAVALALPAGPIYSQKRSAGSVRSSRAILTTRPDEVGRRARRRRRASLTVPGMLIATS